MVSRPGPPHSSGINMPQQPRAPSFWMTSSGKWSVRSQSLTWGRTSVFMKSRTVSRMRSWWSEREKSMALEVEEFAEAFGLLAGDGDFGLFLVVHFEHERGFEPGHDFLDVMNVDEIGAVGAPEGVGVEGFEEFVERAVVG